MMGKNKQKHIQSGSTSDGIEKHLKEKKINVSKTPSKKGESPIKRQQLSCKKKDIINIVKNEFEFISNLFEILDLSKFNQGKRPEDDEENSDSMEVADIPEQKVFKKQTQKKSSQDGVKKKSFPQTIEGLEKELATLKGNKLTYQQKLRRKGLQSRITKKRRKEQMKLTKLAMKSSKKNNTNVNGINKTKPILNNDGNVVSNKFDFADSDMKKDNKKKPGAASNETSNSQSVTNNHNENKNVTEKIKSSKSDSNMSSGFKNSPVKKENISQDTKNLANSDVKSTNKPVFNKENKMVFSKFYIPEGNKKQPRKEAKNKNPKKILEKLKEETKKISELEKEDKEKAVSLKEKQKWATALKRASGEKVKDDPELLKKSIAREKNKKMRSQKKWKARIDHVVKEKEERQKKRKENIQARKTEKKKKKMKKAIKKGSYVPL